MQSAPRVEQAAAFAEAAGEPASRQRTLQRRRRAFQAAFFAFFLGAPALDLLRFDLTQTQLWVMGRPWSLGIDALMQGQITPTQAALTMILRGFLPALLLVAGFLAVAWRYGRLYCGWLCPHFSAVELLNNTLHRAAGKFSLWDKHTTLRADARGAPIRPRAVWWPVFFAASLLLGGLWAVTLLTYLLPPLQIWHNLLHGTLTPNQARFIFIGTGLFTAEFVLARHLFCRFGCAVGLFQSLVWMANPKGMVVAFSRERARECKTCSTVPLDRSQPPEGSACDNACPMRLHPRNIKRMMFSCVQCGQCLTACDASQSAQQRTPVLQWAVGADAVRETLRQRREALQAEARAAAAQGAGQEG